MADRATPREVGRFGRVIGVFDGGIGDPIQEDWSGREVGEEPTHSVEAGDGRHRSSKNEKALTCETRASDDIDETITANSATSHRWYEKNMLDFYRGDLYVVLWMGRKFSEKRAGEADMLKLLVVVLTFPVWLAHSSSGLACTCDPPPPPAVALERADVVFSGIVFAIEERQDSTWGGPITYVTFRVTQAWKGVDGTEQTIITAGMCGYQSFVQGTDYLVYADTDLVPAHALGFPFTGLCDRTKPLSAAQEEIAELSRATVVMQSLWGRIKYRFFQNSRLLDSGG